MKCFWQNLNLTKTSKIKNAHTLPQPKSSTTQPTMKSAGVKLPCQYLEPKFIKLGSHHQNFVRKIQKFLQQIMLVHDQPPRNHHRHGHQQRHHENTWQHKLLAAEHHRPPRPRVKQVAPPRRRGVLPGRPRVRVVPVQTLHEGVGQRRRGAIAEIPVRGGGAVVLRHKTTVFRQVQSRHHNIVVIF